MVFALNLPGDFPTCLTLRPECIRLLLLVLLFLCWQKLPSPGKNPRVKDWNSLPKKKRRKRKEFLILLHLAFSFTFKWIYKLWVIIIADGLWFLLSTGLKAFLSVSGLSVLLLVLFLLLCWQKLSSPRKNPRVKEWNSLPKEVAAGSTLDSFQSTLQHILWSSNSHNYDLSFCSPPGAYIPSSHPAPHIWTIACQSWKLVANAQDYRIKQKKIIQYCVKFL